VVVGGLLIAAAAYASIPLVLPTDRDWLAPAFRLAGAALLLAIVTAYGWAHARGAALVNGPERLRLRAADVSLLLAFPLYLLFVGNGLVLTSADNIPTVALGPVLFERGTIDLSSVRSYQTHRLHYSAVRVGDRILPAYPLGTGLLSVPYVALTSRSLPQGDREVLAQRRDKHLAALLTVAASVMLFAGVRRHHGDAPALATAAVFATGTTVLSSASQALWSLTGALFFLTAALWMLLPEPRSTPRALLGGLAIGGAFVCRPTAVVAGGALAILLWGHHRALLAYAVAFATSAGAAALVLQRAYGHPLGGYGLANASGRWGLHGGEGLLGTLVNPSRGLLPYFPYVLLLPLGLPALREDRRLRTVILAAAIACFGVYLLVSGYDEWCGCKSIGPRLMTDLAPFLALLMVPIFRSWPRLGGKRWLVGLALAFAVATQGLSTYTMRGYTWHADHHLHDPAVRWSVRQSQLLALWCPSCAAPPAP
jgi:hypothetical protein